MQQEQQQPHEDNEARSFLHLCRVRQKGLELLLTKNDDNISATLKDIIDHENHLVELWKRLSMQLQNPQKYKTMTNIEINRAEFCNELLNVIMSNNNNNNGGKQFT